MRRSRGDGKVWRAAGLAAVAFDAVHHGARADGTLETFDDPQRCTYPVETGRNLAVLLDRLAADARVDTARCGVTGVSIGAQMDAARPAIERHAAFMRSIDLAPRLAAFYPRPLFMLCGDLDTHQPKSYTLRLYRALLPVYADHPDRHKLKIYGGVGHDLTPAMMADMTDWCAACLFTQR